MQNTNIPASKRILELSWEFLKQNEGLVFERKELEAYVDKHDSFTRGALVGCHNRLLLEKGPSLGITQVNRGEYCYVAPSNDNTKNTLKEHFEDMFKEGLIILNGSEDLDTEEKIKLYTQLIKSQEDIKNLFK